MVRLATNHKGRRWTLEGNDRAYVLGALLAQAHDMTQRPMVYMQDDAENLLRIIDEGRCALGKAIHPDTDARVERVSESLMRLIQSGKLPKRETGS